MIEQVREEHPEMPIKRLCYLMGVSRSWYYERPSAGEKANKDVELRDIIERGSCSRSPDTRLPPGRGGAEA